MLSEAKHPCISPENAVVLRFAPSHPGQGALRMTRVF